MFYVATAFVRKSLKNERTKQEVLCAGNGVRSCLHDIVT
jgi:hypothetical protein